MNEPKTAEKKKPVEDTKFIPLVSAELHQLLNSKNQDYAPAGEFSNFERAAEFAGLLAFDAMLIQIGIKYTRIQSLHESGEWTHESLRDSFMDLAGYSVIAAAYIDSLQAEQAEEERV